MPRSERNIKKDRMSFLEWIVFTLLFYPPFFLVSLFAPPSPILRVQKPFARRNEKHVNYSSFFLLSCLFPTRICLILRKFLCSKITEQITFPRILEMNFLWRSFSGCIRKKKDGGEKNEHEMRKNDVWVKERNERVEDEGWSTRRKKKNGSRFLLLNSLFAESK